MSGLYRSDASSTEELRLDVDGRYPQNMVSGTVSGRWHWVAEVERDGLGHVGYKRLVDGYSELLEDVDEPAEAVAAQDTLYETLSTREVQGSRVPEAVLREVDERRKRRQGTA